MAANLHHTAVNRYLERRFDDAIAMLDLEETLLPDDQVITVLRAR
mgnify:CR=1 FL=1